MAAAAPAPCRRRSPLPPQQPPPASFPLRLCWPSACPQTRVPGELMEVFAEKMLQACHALLAVVAELKRNALLNDVRGRNEEVR